jgi:hypothetical protein
MRAGPTIVEVVRDPTLGALQRLTERRSEP